MGLMDVFRRAPAAENRFTLADYMAQMSYQGLSYPIINQTLRGEHLESPSDFQGYVSQLYKQNGVVFACMAVRMLLFAEARFCFRDISKGRPGDLQADNGQLALLRKPWTGGTTGDLLSRVIQDADLQGDAFIVRKPKKLVRLRPDWVTVVYGSNRQDSSMWDIDAELLGYLYHPGGQKDRDPEVLLPEEVAHFMPYPDPTSPGRGMSWLTPVMREVLGDQSATAHKMQFFENGATPNMVVKFSKDITTEQFERWVELIDAQTQGAANAYKTLYLGGAAEPEVAGLDFKQMDFKSVQGHGETRIAAAAGVPPIIVGLSEGLEAATYSNYGQARRRFADGTMWPLWRNLAGSMARIVNVTPGTELWIDDHGIPFLREDEKDAAEIQQMNASAIRQLVDGGFDPASVVEAVTAGDLRRLNHSGLVSVQMQTPGSTNGRSRELAKEIK